MLYIPLFAHAEGEQADSPIEVSDAATFIATVEANTAAKIKLTANIDFTGITNGSEKPLIDKTFTGTIDGKGKNAQGQDITYALKNASEVIFKAISGADVHDVVISGSFSGVDECSGQLAYEATNATFTNVSLSGVKAIGDHNSDDCDRMGGLIGKATNCSFTNILCEDVDIESDGYMIGFVAGYAKNCNFTKCISNILCSIWADGNHSYNEGDNAFVGGVVGYAEGGTITSCMNVGLLTANDDEIGGIAGYTNGTTVSLCTNNGILLHADKTNYRSIRDQITQIAKDMYDANANEWSTAEKFLYGGAAVLSGIGVSAILGTATAGVFYGTLTATAAIAPYLAPAILTALATLSIYKSQDPDEIGGICGRAENKSIIKGCTNLGVIKSMDAYAGGIVGYLDESTVIDCCNRGAIYAAEQAGGIVGMNDDSRIERCLSLGSVCIIESSAGRFSGDKSGTTTLTNCCYGSYEGDTGSIDGQKPVSAKQLASGYVAAYFNNLAGADACWNQTLTTDGKNDLFPHPGDNSTAVAESQILENPNCVYKVSNASELNTALMIVNAEISLTADIDMNEKPLVSCSNVTPFRGKIIGNNHKISKVINTAINKRWGIVQVAEHATFSDLTIDESQISTGDKEYEWIGLLAGESNNCRFENINIEKSAVVTKKNLAGCLSGESTSDTFVSCHAFVTTVCSTNTSGNSWVGSLVGKAMNSSFDSCTSDSEVISYGNSNGTGGLVGETTGCTFSKCINTGKVTGNEYLGGITGMATNTGFFYCVNTGEIKGSTSCDKIANIVGRIVNPANDAERKIYQCIGLGKITKGTDGDGRIYGSSGGGNVEYCTALCTINGTTCVLNDLLSGDYTADDVASGKMTYDLNATNYERFRSPDLLWYQSIDNGASTYKFPVPFASNGRVYCNALNGTTSYSNTSDHTCQNYGGFCSICHEYLSGEKGGTVDIANYQDLVNFRYAVHHGNTTLNANVTNDIVFPENSTWEPIGIWNYYPYRGTFSAANGINIDGMKVSTSTGTPAGLFGVVSDGCNISGIIIKSNCTVEAANGTYGAAGIVGCAQPTDNKCNVTITRCGNQATITGDVNVAGIIGGIYDCDDLDDATLTLTDCYNLGDIKGKSQSAAIVAWTKNISAERCVNYASVEGVADNRPVIRYNTQAKSSFKLIYTVAGATQGIAETIDSELLDYGKLCLTLNREVGSKLWGQSMGSDNSIPHTIYPILFDNGIHHDRQMGEYNWGTMIFNAKTVSDENVQFYRPSAIKTGNNSELNLVLLPVDEVSAGTPCFFRKLNADDTTVRIIPKISTVSDNMEVRTKGLHEDNSISGITIYGTYYDIDFKESQTQFPYYYLGKDKLWQNKIGFVLPAYRAMLYIGSNSSAKTINICVDEGGELTNIGTVSADGNVIFNEGPAYNIAGQRVTSTGSAAGYKGILIRNGKKVLVK